MSNIIRWAEGQPDPDQVELDNFIDTQVEAAEEEERLAAQERDEQAIAEGEARYRVSLLGDEAGIGYANPDCLDSVDDFEGDLD